MCRNGKKMTAVGMVILLGCTLPMGTILAAEENAGVVQETEVHSDSTSDGIRDEETISEGEKDTDEVTKENENIPDQDNPDADAEDAEKENDDADAENTEEEDNDADVENIEEDADAEENDEDEETGDPDTEESDAIKNTSQIKQPMSVKAAESQENTSALEIVITSEEQSQTFELGGDITYDYVNHTGRSFNVSVTQEGQPAYYSYCLVEDSGATAKEEEEMRSLSWEQESASPKSFPLSHDGSYVIYVKAAGEGGKAVYRRSDGIVVDTQSPEMVDIVDGGTYPEGTIFQIKDANLESVTINDQPVTLTADNKYQITAKDNSTSCVIKAKDKAGNETSRSITVSEKSPVENIISQNGTYSLQAGTAYQLAKGNWHVEGNRTVYQGGSTFYVKTDGDYVFWKYIF